MNITLNENCWRVTSTITGDTSNCSSLTWYDTTVKLLVSLLFVAQLDFPAMSFSRQRSSAIRVSVTAHEGWKPDITVHLFKTVASFMCCPLKDVDVLLMLAQTQQGHRQNIIFCSKYKLRQIQPATYNKTVRLPKTCPPPAEAESWRRAWVKADLSNTFEVRPRAAIFLSEWRRDRKEFFIATSRGLRSLVPLLCPQRLDWKLQRDTVNEYLYNYKATSEGNALSLMYSYYMYIPWL